MPQQPIEGRREVRRERHTREIRRHGRPQRLGNLDNERQPDALREEPCRMSPVSVFPERVAMVAGQNDDAVVVPSAPPQVGQELPEAGVQALDPGGIRCIEARVVSIQRRLPTAPRIQDVHVHRRQKREERTLVCGGAILIDPQTVQILTEVGLNTRHTGVDSCHRSGRPQVLGDGEIVDGYAVPVRVHQLLQGIDPVKRLPAGPAHHGCAGPDGRDGELRRAVPGECVSKNEVPGGECLDLRREAHRGVIR